MLFFHPYKFQGKKAAVSSRFQHSEFPNFIAPTPTLQLFHPALPHRVSLPAVLHLKKSIHHIHRNNHETAATNRERESLMYLQHSKKLGKNSSGEEEFTRKKTAIISMTNTMRLLCPHLVSAKGSFIRACLC